MLYILYQFFGWLFFIIIFPFVCLRPGFSGINRQGLRQRLGQLKNVPLDRDKPVRIWLHAASVGEIQAARAMIPEINAQLPEASVVVSTGTRQGLIVAHKLLPADVPCFFAPFDLLGIVNRALDTIRPTIYVCLETELWPNIIRQAHKRGISLFLLNGRLSEKSYAGYRKIKGFMHDLLSCFTAISVIQAGDAKRFRALGANPGRIKILGNAKYEQPPGLAGEDAAEHYRLELGIDRRQPVLVTGSTHTGEEEILIKVFHALKQRLPDLVWVVAPRHLNRLAEVERLFAEHRIASIRLSNAQKHGRTAETDQGGERKTGKGDVIIVDSMGELAGLYSLAAYIFCGGSLVERGGHNVLEAAAWGNPVFYGPYMADFADARAMLEAEQAGFCVQSPEELTAMLLHYIDNPGEYEAARDGARRVAARQHGSAAKQVALLKEILSPTTL